MFPATPGPVTLLTGGGFIGRADECSTRLEGAEISRRHAEIVLRNHIPVLRDVDSRNGCHVNGRKITESPLALGDVVRLGEWVGIVSAVGHPDRGFGEIADGLAGGPRLARALDVARAAAKSDLPIVVLGETGTGKELAARAIHAWSGRSKRPFVPVNCSRLPEALADGLLFGHVRGAFTGADRASDGHFRSADGGTLFLDEIADLPFAVQPKLLRTLEDGEVQRLGESHTAKVDVRIIAAAQEPLRAAVEERRFRGDLLARLEGANVELPPLRERREDIPYLFSFLVARHSPRRALQADAQLVERLCLYDWPFNVRELSQVVRNLTALHGEEPLLKRSHLPPRFQDAAPPPSSVAPPSPPQRSEGTRDERELAAFLSALRAQGGNVAKAAAVVGISRQRAYRLMQERADIDPEDFRDATLR
jgi:DNA-binding NtrC family response regulator